jgi:hypothetical protein
MLMRDGDILIYWVHVHEHIFISGIIHCLLIIKYLDGCPRIVCDQNDNNFNGTTENI